MKELDAKVDDAHPLVMYVERADASYGPLQTGSFMAKNYLDDFFEKRERNRQRLQQEIREGLISPIGYYAGLLGIADADLASRVGVSSRILRKHQTPAGFADITMTILGRYAQVFGIPVANLLQILIPNDAPFHLVQEPTASPLVVLAHIVADEPHP